MCVAHYNTLHYEHMFPMFMERGARDTHDVMDAVGRPHADQELARGRGNANAKLLTLAHAHSRTCVGVTPTMTAVHVALPPPLRTAGPGRAPDMFAHSVKTSPTFASSDLFTPFSAPARVTLPTIA